MSVFINMFAQKPALLCCDDDVFYLTTLLAIYF